MGYGNSIDNSPIQRVVAVDVAGQPAYSSTLIAPVTINNGTPTAAGTGESIATLKINTTGQTGVDGNAQATTGGLTLTGSVNGSYAPLELQNKNNGTLASTDMAFYNDATTDVFNGPYYDIGFTSSLGNNPAFPILPIGAYQFTTSDHIAYGTLANKDHIFHTNGAATTNERLRITGAGAVKISNGPLQTAAKTVLGTTGTVSLDPTLGNLFTCTPTAAITALNAASVPTGQLIYIVFTTSGTSSFVVTFNTNFKTTGTLATGTVSGKVFTMTFISDGTNFNETSRTTAM